MWFHLHQADIFLLPLPVTSLLRSSRYILLTLLAALLTGCQAKLIYYPKAYHDGYYRAVVKRGGQRIEYKTRQGRQVAHYMPPLNGARVPKVIWICYGGNNYLGLDWMQYIGEWNPSFGYLLMDYPGYGDCKGIPSPGKIRQSSKDAVKALAQHLQQTLEQLQPKLRVLGHSIGCAAGLMTADDLKIQKVILIAPFTTLTEMGKRYLGWPLCYVNIHRFNNRKFLAQVVENGAQVVIYHGTEDQVIPISMSRELVAAHPGKVTLIEKEGEDHNYILNNIGLEVGQMMSSMSR